jgi:hypothetical protein
MKMAFSGGMQERFSTEGVSGVVFANHPKGCEDFQ